MIGLFQEGFVCFSDIKDIKVCGICQQVCQKFLGEPEFQAHLDKLSPEHPFKTKKSNPVKAEASLSV